MRRPLGAVVAAATGRRLTEVPMSPPRILKALGEPNAAEAKGGRGMVHARLGGPLPAAANIRELLTRLGEDHPSLKPVLDKGVTMAIDGVLYRGAWCQPILPRVAGG